MTEQEQSLMQAIIHNPFDDTPRLILADWYEENGHQEWAQIIRTLISLGGSCGCTCGARGPSHKCSVCKLFDVKNVSGISAKIIVRRGFIDQIGCTFSAFLGSLCTKCGGNGFRRREDAHNRRDCQQCNGLGREGGIAKKVGENWPITRVFIYDAVVHPSNGNDTYYLGGLGSFPQKYWKSLDNHRSRGDVRYALERVCVSYMRELANLPPLDGFIF